MPYNIEDPRRDMDDLVVVDPDQARHERGLELYLRHRINSIDLEQRVLSVTDLEADQESTVSYDALILATGARPERPNLPGFELPGVEVLRVMDDGVRIKQALDARVRNVVIVGAGALGMEMAHVLTSREIEVTVLERLPRVLPGWHGDTVTRVEKVLEREGVRALCAASVQAIEAGPDGRVCAVVTDQERLAAELVVVAVGIRANVALAASAGLRLGDSGAIWVNQHQLTSNDAVWAAGDCAEVYHRVLRRNTWKPLATTANKQGRVAGANAAGAMERFAGVVGTAAMKMFDLEVARTGLSTRTARDEGFEPVETTVRQRSRAHGYPGGSTVQVTLVADGPTGLLLGAELTGEEGAALRANTVAAALAAHMSVTDLQQLDLAYAPPFAPVWDPLLVAANQLSKKIGRSR
jgi:NADPH-dependent 2,4-dienoyl-CoA reductase/sulfur reductase-like enzyme